MGFIQYTMHLWQDFAALFYPKSCAACGASLYRHEGDLCNKCYIHLPKSGYHLERGNPVEKLFWGRMPVLAAGSFYLFNKGTKVQRLLHQLKYKGKKEAGETVGEWYGTELKKLKEFSEADCIVPVPLHPRRLRERGYNQSACFAKGLSKEMGIPLDEGIILRKQYTATQTKKSKYKRWENMSEIFEADLKQLAEGRKHILLVDDVITTGATLEACYKALAKGNPDIYISVVSIAFTE